MHTFPTTPTNSNGGVLRVAIYGPSITRIQGPSLGERVGERVGEREPEWSTGTGAENSSSMHRRAPQEKYRQTNTNYGNGFD